MAIYIVGSYAGAKSLPKDKSYANFIANTIISKLRPDFPIELCRMSDSYDTRMGYKYYMQQPKWKHKKSKKIVIALNDEYFNDLNTESMYSDIDRILNVVGLSLVRVPFVD